MNHKIALYAAVVILGLSACKKNSGNRDINSTSVSNLNAAELALVGNGFDRISGAQKENCIGINSSGIEITNLNKVQSNIEIVDNKVDLYRKTEKTSSAGGGISLGFFRIGGSRAKSTIKEIKMNTRDFVAVAEITYVDKHVRVKEESPPLLNDIATTLEENDDIFEFRDKCGDLFVKEATYGSRLLLLVKASTAFESNFSAEEASSSFGFGIQWVVGIGVDASSSSSEINKDVLSQMRFEAYCLTEGAAPPSICGNYNIDFTNDQLIAQAAEQFKIAKEAFIEAVEKRGAGDEHVRLEMELQDYAELKNRVEARTDQLDDRIDAVNEIFELSEQMESDCDELEIGQATCSKDIRDINAMIVDCSTQSRWDQRCPTVPTREEVLGQFSSLNLRNPGTVTLFSEQNQQGQSMQLVFENLFTNFAEYQANTPYYLGDDDRPFRGQEFDDILKSVDVDLAPGWEIVFYQHPNRQGFVYKVDGKQKVNIADIAGGSIDGGGISEIELRRTQ